MTIKLHLIFAAVATLCISLPYKTNAGLEALGTWSAPSTVLLPSNNGPIQATVRQLQFTFRRSTDNEEENRTVKLVVVPSRNLYWLGYSGLGSRAERQFFLFGNQIVGVSTQENNILRFYPSNNLLKTDDTDKEVDRILRQKLDKYESEEFDVHDIPVAVGIVIGVPAPFTGKASDFGEPAPTITKVDVGNETFTIELAGGKGNSVKATVTFNSSIEPVKATLQGKQVFPK